MQTNFDDVKDTFRKYKFPHYTTPTLLPTQAMVNRLELMQEELDELYDAMLGEDLPEVIDALIDLAYFTLGTAVAMGIDWQAHWDEVHRANMAKEPGVKSTRPHQPYDIIKPDGWCPPDHEAILNAKAE